MTSQLARDVGSTNPRRYFEAVAGFVKLAKCQFAAPLAFHRNLDARPIAIYLADTALGITRLAPDSGPFEAAATAFVDLSDKLACAVVNEHALAFSGVRSMETALFHATGDKLGAAITF